MTGPVEHEYKHERVCSNCDRRHVHLISHTAAILYTAEDGALANIYRKIVFVFSFNGTKRSFEAYGNVFRDTVGFIKRSRGLSE